MMNILGLLCSLLVATLTLGAPAADLVTNLPGQNFVTNYDQYSGYLNGTDTRFLHYWFFESQNDPANDPIILWMNGGPGCSSLLGLLTELGPFYVDQDGTGVLYQNPYSWNTFSNIFFLEAPVCVGFSYSDDDCVSTDDSTAAQNYAAIQDFFRKFPEYQTNEFYITGESYCGIYIPTLTELIVDGQATSEVPFNFQGFAIGNGYFDVPANSNSLMFYGYYHGILGESLWSKMVASCCTGPGNRDNCDFTYSDAGACQALVTQAYHLMYYDGLNPYSMYATCGASASRLAVELGHMSKNAPIPIRPFQPNAELDSSYEPACSDNAPEITWLNQPDVRAALHISASAQDWEPCSSIPYTQTYSNVVDKIVKVANITRGLIYNGDADMVCNFVGNLWDVEDIGLPVIEDRRTWKYNGQVLGFVKRFETIDFLTIKGAGHMVPGNEPAASLQFIKAFIEKTPY